ncbi:MAG TPA: hypothetical protein VGE43_13650 [Acidimicrobiales bacterium]
MSNEFLDLLETVKAEEASVTRLFNSASDGRGVRSMRRDDPRYLRSLAEATALVAGVVSGRTPMHRLQEAMSTSDFPLLFGDIIDRSMLGKYAEWPTVWAATAKRGTVKDFRSKRQFVLDGAESILSEVPQGQEYPEAAVTENKYDYSVKKYGRRVPFLWEVFVNDDLDMLRDTPTSLAKAARMSEERFAAELYVDSTGPDAVFFSAGNGNRITTGGAGLNVTNLQAAFTALWSQKDADGNPIFTGKVRLVVPPALAVVANNIANATEIRAAGGGGVGTGADQITTTNWMSNQVTEVVVNPWLPIIDTSANKNTTWYLFADTTVGRPAMEMGFLRGHESPELFMKAPNAVRIGGGTVGAEEGSFETDGIDYKVRHVFGGGLLEPKSGLAFIGV